MVKLTFSPKPPTIPPAATVKGIPSGKYFIGTMGSFDAEQNRGVFLKVSGGVTFIEASSQVGSSGGRWWPDSYQVIYNYEEVDLSVIVVRK